MKAKNDDLYLLQDGTYADPKDCSAGKDGVIRHKNGLAVAMRDDGEPMTLHTVAELDGNAAAAEAGAGEGGLLMTEATVADKPKAE
jgi:hypothetical protein